MIQTLAQAARSSLLVQALLDLLRAQPIVLTLRALTMPMRLHGISLRRRLMVNFLFVRSMPSVLATLVLLLVGSLTNVSGWLFSNVMMVTLLVILSSLLAIIEGVAVRSGRGIVRSIEAEVGSLREGATRFGAGELSHRIPVPGLEVAGASVPSHEVGGDLYYDLELPAGRLRYTSAGHNPVLRVSAGGEVSWLKQGGVPLCVRPESRYPAAEFPLDCGDVRVAYSDGVTEAEGHDHAGQTPHIGEERFAETVTALRAEPIEAIVPGVVAAVKVFAAGRPQADDITVVVPRRVQDDSAPARGPLVAEGSSGPAALRGVYSS